MFWLLFSLTYLVYTSAAPINERPIIGVLSQAYFSGHNKTRYDSYNSSYIAASYVKYLESAGARVVPIEIDKEREYYVDIVNQTNGLLIPGGGQDLVDSGYARAGKTLLDLAIAANNKRIYYPVWGTCLGFELLTVLMANWTNYLTSCHVQDVPMPLNFTDGFEQSSLFKNADENIIQILRKENVTANYHSRCLTPENFTKSGLDKQFRVLSTNVDPNNAKLTFISTIEHNKLPFYGTQYHPEKNNFEFVFGEKHQHIPHSADAVLISQYFANFFVNEARKNRNRFLNDKIEAKSLIYNYTPLYVGLKKSASFEQIYVFPIKRN